MFSFNPSLFVASLPIVVQGMLGIFIVTTAIIISVMLLNLFGILFTKKK